MNFAEALLAITQCLDAQQTAVFCNLLWSIWKSRNEELFRGNKGVPEAILRQASTLKTCAKLKRGESTAIGLDPIEVPGNTSLVVVDASWDQSSKTGTAFVKFDGSRRLTFLHCRYQKATDPFHAEALALMEALEYIQNTPQMDQFLILSDCKTLVNLVVQGTIEGVPTWQATETVGKCIWIYDLQRNRANLIYARREFVTIPHQWANFSRRTGQSYDGPPQQGPRINNCSLVPAARINLGRSELNGEG